MTTPNQIDLSQTTKSRALLVVWWWIPDVDPGFKVFVVDIVVSVFQNAPTDSHEEDKTPPTQQQKVLHI